MPLLFLSLLLSLVPVALPAAPGPVRALAAPAPGSVQAAPVAGLIQAAPAVAPGQALAGPVHALAAPAPGSVQAVAPARWGWPLPGTPVVTRGFDPPSLPWLAGHRGVDLAGTPAQTVLAAGAGVVAFAGYVAGVGVVSIDHPGGLRTTYQPVTPSVSAGQSVSLGTPVGLLLAGHEGCPVTACLHWGLRRGEVYLNPLLLLRPWHVRLKPL